MLKRLSGHFRCAVGTRVSFTWIPLFMACALLIGMPCTAAAQSIELPAPIDLSKAISLVAKRNIPAVVHIEVIQRQNIPNPLFPFENEPFFRFFFDLPRMPREFKREYRGIGSGMIMDASGHILTNYHVVAGATEIKALVENGESFPAALVGVEPQTDLAVLKISADRPFSHVTFGDSDKMEVGDWVVAIGPPRGLDHTVTQGIISAKHRRGILSPSSYQDFLQTDAAINPGNSGGPLINLQGEVIGVNAAIVSQSGGFEGIGFAIPSNMAMHVAQQIITKGSVSRGWIGITLQEVNPLLARSFGLEETKGALIADVIENSPADKAGLKRGDVVLACGGKPIRDSADFRNMLSSSKIGAVLQLKVWRDGTESLITVKVADQEDAPDTKALSIRGKLGVELRPTRAQEVRRYGPKAKQGLVIVWIDPNGPLGQAGFELNDLILEVNGSSVRNVEQLWELLESQDPRRRRTTFLAMDHRSGRTGYVQVSIK